MIDDPPKSATAIGARPDPYERWETLLIGEDDRQAEKYAGYSLSIPLVHVAKRCARR